MEYKKNFYVTIALMLTMVLASCSKDDNDLSTNYWQYDQLIGYWVPEANEANGYLYFLSSGNVAGIISTGDRIIHICDEVQHKKGDDKAIILTKVESGDGGKMSEVIYGFEWVGQNKDAIMLSSEKWIKKSGDVNPYWDYKDLSGEWLSTTNEGVSIRFNADGKSFSFSGLDRPANGRFINYYNIEKPLAYVSMYNAGDMNINGFQYCEAWTLRFTNKEKTQLNFGGNTFKRK